jgi:hypothetical protein
MIRNLGVGEKIENKRVASKTGWQIGVELAKER